ncbi:MAG: hypothetical protein K2K56_07330 [Lachnospiraceae bacterium]|nr:hypothetical protein [Lachnospiraceae bacterium]
MKNYMDQTTSAQNAGEVHLSKRKFKELRDDVLKVPFLKKGYYNRQFERINQYLAHGDTQPAVVTSLNPLVISAYSDEMDAVVLLRFPYEMQNMYILKKGMRLVTSNVYFRGSQIAADIIVGEKYLNRWVDFIPMVQLFLSDDEEFIKQRIGMFQEEMWERVEILTEKRIKQNNNIKMRNGFYYLTGI